MVESRRLLQLERYGKDLRADYAFNMITNDVESVTQIVNPTKAAALAADLGMPNIEKIIIHRTEGTVEVVAYSHQADEMKHSLTDRELGLVAERYNLTNLH